MIINYLYNLIQLAIPAFIFISIAIFYALSFRKKIVETYFLSAVTIIVVLFLTGLLNFKGSLLVGYSLLFAFSLFSFAYLIKRYLQERDILNRICLIQGFGLFSFFLLFSLFLNFNRMFILWDEFSHWGSILKNMYILDALGTFNETSGHVVKTYLEGSSLFQYFWMRPFRVYTEYPAYIATNLLYFSIISPFIKKYNLKNIVYIILALLIPLLGEGYFYSSLYVDTIIGLLLGAGFVYYHYYKYESSRFGILMVLASITLLSLIKDVGFVYSIVLAIIIFFDFILFKKRYLKRIFSKSFSFIKKLKYTLLILVPLFIPFVITLVWKSNINATLSGAEDTVVTKGIQLVLSNLIQLINGDLPPHQLNILLTFHNALLHKPIVFYYFSYADLIVLLVTITFAFALFFKKKNFTPLRLIVNFFLLIFGSLSSIFVILITYLFIFSEYEALNLASFGRYILSYIIGIFFAFLLFLLLKPKKSSSVKIQRPFVKETINILKHLFLFMAFFLLLFTTSRSIKENIIFARDSVHSSITTREYYGRIINWSKYIPEDKEGKLYVIAQADKGLIKLITIYNLIPTDMKWITDYSVSTEHYYPEYPWTKIISPEDWEIYIMRNYEFVYIFKHDENFINLYGQFFDEVRDDSLYKVTTDDNGNMKLLSIQKE